MATTKKAAPKKVVANEKSDKSIKAVPSPDIFDAKRLDEGVKEGPGNEIPKYDHDAYLLERSMHELKSLRKQNQHMAARLDMFDKVYTLFSTGNSSGRDSVCQGSIEDSIEKRLYEKRDLATKS